MTDPSLGRAEPSREELLPGAPRSGTVPAEHRLELRAGDFIALVVEQGRVDRQSGAPVFEPGNGVDLILTLLDPSGAEVATRDSLWGTSKPERLAWIAESSGGHTLRITGTQEDGAFRLTIERRRRATDEDHRIAEADAALARAESVYLSHRYRRAECLYRRAFESLLDLDDAWGRERRLYVVSSLYKLAEDLKRKQLVTEVELYAGTAITLETALGEGTESFEVPSARINLGSILRGWGNLRLSEKLYHRALEICRQIGDIEKEAAVHNNLGVLYRELGNYEKAEHHYGRALALNRQLGETGGRKFLERIARTLGNLGWVYHMQDEVEKAHDHYRRSIDAARELGDAVGEAGALNGLGRLEVEEGRFDQAVGPILRSIIVHHSIGRSAGLAGAFQTLGDLGAGQQLWDEAEEAFDNAYRVASESGHRHLMASVDIRRARVAAARGQLERALELGRRSLAGIDQLRDGAVEPISRARFVASRRHYYEIHLAHLLAAHEQSPSPELLTELFEIVEHSHARSLYEALSEQSPEPGSRHDAELLARERAIVAKLAELDRRHQAQLEMQRRDRANAPGPEAIRALGQKIDNLRVEAGHLQTRIRDQNPTLAAFRGLAPITLEQVMDEQLEDDELVLHLTLGDEKSLLLAIDRHQVEVIELPARDLLEAKARRWLDELTARQRGIMSSQKAVADARARALAHELSELLLAPVAHRLRGQPLVLVPDGIFHALPFAALPMPGVSAIPKSGWFRQTLLGEHELSIQPSLSVLAALRESWARRPGQGIGVAVWADPVFSRHDPRIGDAAQRADPTGGRSIQPHAAIRQGRQLELARLAASAHEAKSLRRFWQGTRCFVGFDADKASLGAVSEYGLLHFATHGRVDEQRPELSGLALSMWDERGNEQDGLLRLVEIEALELSADLVVLSACETALGEALRGEGLLSLMRGFLHAGARRVIASRWLVDDVVTAELMDAFYCHLLGEGLSPAEALRQAQLEIAARYDAPYFWAAFMLQGEWR